MNTPLRRVIFAFACFAVLLAGGTALLRAQSGSNHGTILGSVTDPTGAVVPGAKVSILNPVSGFTRAAVSDGAGHYEFSQRPVRSLSPDRPRRRLQRLRHRRPGQLRRSGQHHQRADGRRRLDRHQRRRRRTSSATTPACRPRSTATPSPRSRWRASPPRSARWSPSPRPASPPTPTASSTAWAITPPTPSPSTASPSPTSRARSSPTSCPPTPCSPCRSSPALRRPSTAARPRWSSRSPPAPASASPGPPAASPPPTEPSAPPPAPSTSATAARTSATSSRSTASTPAASSIRPSSPSSTTRATSRTSSTASTARSRQKDSIHLNLNYSRSWFQTPNAYDNLNVQNVVAGGTGSNPTFGDVGNTDQRSKIQTFDIAPTYTRVLGPNAVFNFGAFVRKDAYNYYPSNNPLADLGPPNLQTSSIGQQRTPHQRRPAHRPFLREGHQQHQDRRQLRARPSCARTTSSASSRPPTTRPASTPTAIPLPGYADPTQCGANYANPNYNPVLAPYDLTRGGNEYHVRRPHRRQRDRPVRRGPDPGQAVALQRRHPRRPLQRPHRRPPGRAPRRPLLHRQADQHRPARLLRPHPGDALQREPRALQPGLLQRRPQPAARLRARVHRNHAARLPQRVPRRPRTDLRPVPRRQRRLRLEVHAQRLRLLGARQHAHHLPHRLA